MAKLCAFFFKLEAKQAAVNKNFEVFGFTPREVEFGSTDFVVETVSHSANWLDKDIIKFANSDIDKISKH